MIVAPLPLTRQNTDYNMSAYGAILKADGRRSLLPTTRWTTRDKVTGSPIPIDLYHLTLETALKSPGLVEYLHSVFARVVEDGRTYPMEVAEGEEYTRQAFESYFFAADVVIGVLAGGQGGDGPSDSCQDGDEIVPGTDYPFGPSGSSKDGQPLVWEDVIVGFYYVSISSSPPPGQRQLIPTVFKDQTQLPRQILARTPPHCLPLRGLVLKCYLLLDLQRGVYRPPKTLEQRLR